MSFQEEHKTSLWSGLPFCLLAMKDNFFFSFGKIDRKDIYWKSNWRCSCEASSPFMYRWDSAADNCGEESDAADGTESDAAEHADGSEK